MKLRRSRSGQIILPKGYELVKGKLVELNRGMLASCVTVQIGCALSNFCKTEDSGWVVACSAYHCFPEAAQTIRRPSCSFIRGGRFPNNRLPEEDATIVPDLTVDAVGYQESAYDLEERIQDYLSVGIPLFWIVFTLTRTAYVYRSDGRIRRLTEQDYLDGEDILPGFRCLLAEVFPESKPEITDDSDCSPLFVDHGLARID